MRTGGSGSLHRPSISLRSSAGYRDSHHSEGLQWLEAITSSVASESSIHTMVRRGVDDNIVLADPRLPTLIGERDMGRADVG